MPQCPVAPDPVSEESTRDAGRSEELRRAITFIESVEERAAGRVESHQAGIAVGHDLFPDVYSLNFFRVDPAHSPRSAPELASIADELQRPRNLKHRRVLVNDGPLGATLAPGFRDLGWVTDRLVVMGLREFTPGTSTIEVLELPEEKIADARKLYYAWRSEPAGTGLSDEVVDQLIQARKETATAVHVRNYAAMADDQIAAFCDLYSDGTIAQIEDVGTIQPFRRRGLGRAVVEAAVKVALEEGHGFIFLVADAEDWPKELYARLGFEALGDIYEFTLLPDRAAGA